MSCKGYPVGRSTGYPNKTNETEKQMPVIGYIDLETTGLDFEKDQITEIGFVRKDWGSRKPLSMQHRYLFDPEYDVYQEVPEFITELTGITSELLKKCGNHPATTLIALSLAMNECDFIMAHNGECFDKPMLIAKMRQYSVEPASTPWLDSQHDIDWPYSSRRLVHLCTDAGFLNPFPHDALSDVLSMVKLVEWAEGKHFENFDALVEYSRQPWIYLKAHVSYNDRDQAKALRYQWEKIDTKIFSKTWVKKVKESRIEKEKEEASFPISIIGS